MDEEQSQEYLSSSLDASFLYLPRLQSLSFPPRLSPVCVSHHLIAPFPASEQLPLLRLKKMKADESIWPVALKCTCLRPSLGGRDNEPID